MRYVSKGQLIHWQDLAAKRKREADKLRDALGDALSMLHEDLGGDCSGCVGGSGSGSDLTCGLTHLCRVARGACERCGGSRSVVSIRGEAACPSCGVDVVEVSA